MGRDFSDDLLRKSSRLRTSSLNLPRKLLPPKAKEGSWLTLDIVPEGDIVGGRDTCTALSSVQCR